MTKLIVITGISRGLGQALTERFIQSGHTVLGCARSEATVEKFNQQFGSPHNFTALDVADEEQVKAWAKRLLSEYAPPDLLINNAGMINELAPLWQIPSEDFSRLIDVNIKGVASVIRHFVPAMIEKGSGVIVNLSSGWGRSTSAQVSSYCASKWAIEGMTRSLAQELPPGMAAIPLNPGIIHTDMLEICYGEDAASYTAIKDWVEKAVPFLLQLSPADNGMPLTVPA
ncbi:MAG: SDR family oxidoreductase [Symplocastrum torsivum CPER-KK1]|jgi:NAD(P)-dependent dehydrogenase (short-subunit alcohol dehydrogenase family)|uniref:SDR family oxidoreductase n=1 Tax=Symplocastrum torsivum CPER-KK1 TaxID=450513 RepID=A0A951UA90_9CYAN|nr:SDR family oxidoreductase [Symplocastrum torsivum CPER-KK1]